MLRLLSCCALVLTLAACGSSQAPTGGSASAGPAGKTTLGACALKSPLRDYGAGRDVTGRVDLVPPPAVPRPASAQLNSGACAGNQAFQIGTGVQDMTGPAGDSISAGYESPTHVLRGIHLRQFARAFALRSPCNGKRVILAVTETGFLTQGTRQTVLDLIAADPELAPHYDLQNVMMSATHTHSGPGGEAHHAAYNLFRLGYDALVHEIYTQALYRAIRQAHLNLEANPQAGRVRLALGELLDANTNRSEEAYARNPESERQQWLNRDGGEVNVNKLMVQLRFDREDGTPIGLLNWFGVHTTSMGTASPLLSSDNKGLAAISFERMFETDYTAPDGADRFVAAFAQADEGDASPNLCYREFPFPDPRIGCGVDRVEGTAAHGVKQLARAVELFDAGGQPLTGSIDSRLFHVKMDKITITDPVILDSLQHPSELDEPVKRTCTAALGFSMAAGADDQRGPTQEGITCENISLPQTLAGDLQVVLNTIAANATAGGYPALPAQTVGSVVGCGLTAGLGSLPGLPDVDYSCHAEKPILFPIGTTELISNSDLPFQIVALGNLAVIALPWEVTTTSARRIRDTVMAELRGAGIEHAVVASLSNDFVQYLTTREEYADQQYEGASTHFGPWTLAAVQQEIRKLAISLRDGTAPPDGVPAPRTMPSLPYRLPYLAGDARPFGGDYGDVQQDANAQYKAGETVTVRFAGGHPRNDVREKLNDSYLYAEHEAAPGFWQVVARDRDPELVMGWHPTPELPVAPQLLPWRQSVIEATWHLPANLPAGRYRLRHSGTAVPSFDQRDAGQRVAYEGVSAVFEVAATGAECPGYPAAF
jgi:neutral ceramidase